MNGKSWLIILGATIATVAFSGHAFAQCEGKRVRAILASSNRVDAVILVNKNQKQAIKVISIAVPSTVYDVYANSTITPTVLWGQWSVP